MFWPQPDRLPCWLISQAPVSSKRAVTGTVRSAPVLRPTVSSSAARVVRIPSLLRVRTAGLATYLPTTRSNRNFRNAFCSALVFIDSPYTVRSTQAVTLVDRTVYYKGLRVGRG